MLELENDIESLEERVEKLHHEQVELAREWLGLSPQPSEDVTTNPATPMEHQLVDALRADGYDVPRAFDMLYESGDISVQEALSVFEGAMQAGPGNPYPGPAEPHIGEFRNRELASKFVEMQLDFDEQFFMSDFASKWWPNATAKRLDEMKQENWREAIGDELEDVPNVLSQYESDNAIVELIDRLVTPASIAGVGRDNAPALQKFPPEFMMSDTFGIEAEYDSVDEYLAAWDVHATAVVESLGAFGVKTDLPFGEAAYELGTLRAQYSVYKEFADELRPPELQAEVEEQAEANRGSRERIAQRFEEYSKFAKPGSLVDVHFPDEGFKRPAILDEQVDAKEPADSFDWDLVDMLPDGTIVEKVQKRNDYTVDYEVTEPGTEVYNHLEDCHYVTTDEKCVVLTGTQGEQWVVTKDKLLSTYQLDADELAANPKGTVSPQPDGTALWVRPAVGQEVVTTSWGEELTANREGIAHGDGDMVVYSVDEDGKCNAHDAWVVNGAVFANTYKRYGVPEAQAGKSAEQGIEDDPLEGMRELLRESDEYAKVANARMRLGLRPMSEYENRRLAGIGQLKHAEMLRDDGYDVPEELDFLVDKGEITQLEATFVTQGAQDVGAGNPYAGIADSVIVFGRVIDNPDGIVDAKKAVTKIIDPVESLREMAGDGVIARDGKTGTYLYGVTDAGTTYVQDPRGVIRTDLGATEVYGLEKNVKAGAAYVIDKGVPGITLERLEGIDEKVAAAEMRMELELAREGVVFDHAKEAVETKAPERTSDVETGHEVEADEAERPTFGPKETGTKRPKPDDAQFEHTPSPRRFGERETEEPKRTGFEMPTPFGAPPRAPDDGPDYDGPEL